MVKGVGIDSVSIPEMKRHIQQLGFIKHTFTEAEVHLAEDRIDQEEYYAGRFAVKEAVFKALAHHTKARTFDLRMIETLNDSDGYPYLSICSQLSELMKEAGISEILISITTEGEYATAIAVANSK
jgi:holo-[acyl-carrier protein] synthase